MTINTVGFEAVQQDGSALEYASGVLQADKRFVLEAVNKAKWPCSSIRIERITS